jgi:hypothetical protein
VTVVAVAVAALLVAATVWLVRGTPSTAPAPQATAASSAPVPQQTQRPTTLRAPAGCDPVTHRFVPRSLSVPGVTRHASVVAPPRDANDIPGTPPLTRAGSWQFAWDREQGILPGQPRGNVIVNAHTWPDGSAIGNRLLAELHLGDRVVVAGAQGQRLCYRVTERVEVPASTLMPRYYTKDGPPQIAILVCSGRRLGPGIWTKRTVWFASPVEVPGRAG